MKTHIKKVSLTVILLLAGLNLLLVSCGKIQGIFSQFTQKDYSGNYILYGGPTLIEIHRNPDQSFWITLSQMSTMAKVKGSRILYSFYGGSTSTLIIESDGKTLNGEYNGKLVSNIGRKIDDNELWSALQAFTNNDFANAELGLQSYLQSHPNDVFVQLILTKAMLQEGKITEAKSEIAKYENNPELQSNHSFKQSFVCIKYDLTGKEKSSLGFNAWDGYQETINLTQAAPQVSEKIYRDIRKIETTQIPLGLAERESIQQYLAPNFNAIQKFLNLPEKTECYVTWASLPPSTIIPRLLRAQSLAKSVVLYGRLQAEKGNMKEAVEAYRRVIRFGQQMTQGSLLNQLVGIPIRVIGENGFSRLFSEGKIAHADKAQLMLITLKELRRLDPISTLDALLQLEPEPHIAKLNIRAALNRAHVAESKLILLETTAATKLYQLQEGKLPESIQTLIPTYIPELPVDTFAKNPIILKSFDQLVVLYSYGPDTTNDNGQIIYDPTNGVFSRGDLLLQ
jgi:tetratricopeptide (TPR) repeat protein